MIRRVAPFFAALALSGCAEIDAARRAQDPDSAGPGERTVAAREIGLDAGSTLSLERGLELALTHNPTVAASRSRVDAASARLEQVDAGYWPQASLSANLRGQQSGGGTVTGSSDADATHGGSVSISQLLFDFGKTSALSRQARQQWVAAQSDLRNSENEITFSLRQAFFTVLKQRELVRVAEETVRQFEKRLEQVKGFLEVGSRTKYDLTKAQVDLGNAQLSLVKARTAHTNSRATLNNILGLAEDPDYTVEKPRPDELAPPSLEELVAQARDRHPRLLAQIFRERAAVAAIDAAIADMFPQLSLQASFSYSGAMTPVSWNWLIGPVVNWLVFSGWSRSGKIREEVAALREARATRAQLEQQIFLDIRQALTSLDDARERLKISTLTVQQAQENLDLVQGRYAIGRASSVELTDAQVALANARSEQVQAEFDLQIATAALRRALGSLPEEKR